MPKVKVPIVFFGTVVFSAHRDGRYIINLTYYFRKLLSRCYRPLEFIESLLLHYMRTLRLAILPSKFSPLTRIERLDMDVRILLQC